MNANRSLIRLIRARDDTAAKGEDGGASEQEIEAAREEMVETGAAHAAPALERMMAALDHVVPVARELGVRIGIEPRYYYVERDWNSSSDQRAPHACSHASLSIKCVMPNAARHQSRMATGGGKSVRVPRCARDDTWMPS